MPRSTLNAQRQTAPVTAYVAIGANLGDARGAVREGLRALAGLPNTFLAAASPLYRSAPVDAGGPDYVNAVVALQTRLAAPDLLNQLHAIEHAAGRQRPGRNAPRTLDLDLLLYGDTRIESAHLTLPHPRMRERAFVLRPLADIAPDRVSAQDLARVAGQRIEKIEGEGN
ncbi:MAG: 2-amino-4-hydroxy-6-hydroxymethyldihydropteridine diphosphokinase [Burkholderiaceae bacterium]|jgi:2-amino-4-hydroxy-6-hydroxymethyldihydropteridine diphosphokinase|nr:2-amino-4-hydroxy-6-hydroxymethyldihydropteridine diphosphokinase [Burkholderiaceae bacterium]